MIFIRPAHLANWVTFYGDLKHDKGRDLAATLKRLAKEFGEHESYDVVGDSVSALVDDLACDKIFTSRSGPIRAWAACCFVEVFRLSMPVYYYNEKQMPAVFHFLLKELRKLEDEKHPFYDQYFFCIERIFQTDCISLFHETDEESELILEAFDVFYSVIRKNKDETLEFMFASALSTVLLCAEKKIPAGVAQMIFQEFIDSHKAYAKIRVLPQDAANTRIATASSPGLTMSTNICKDALEPMTNVFCTTVAELLTQTDNGDAAGELIVAVWHYAPKLVANIIPQLKRLLSDDEPEKRVMPTVVIGEMLGLNKMSEVNFLTDYRSTFNAWLCRKNDTKGHIRAVWAEKAELSFKALDFYDSEPICDGIRELLADNEAEVRLAACIALNSMAIENVNKTGHGLVQDLAFRLRDKQSKVRRAAFQTIGNWYSKAYSHIAAKENDYVDTFGDIPSIIFELVYVDDKEVGEEVESCLFEYIFPLNDPDDESRALRILNAVSRFSESALNSLKAVADRQVFMSKYLSAILNPAIADTDRIESVIDWVSVQFSHPELISGALKWLVLEEKDSATLKALARCLDPETDYSLLLKSKNMFLGKVGNKRGRDTAFTNLILRAGYIITNKLTFTPLMRLNKSNSNVNKFMEHIAGLEPYLLKSEIDTIGSMIKKLNSMESSEQISCLRTASFLFKAFSDVVPNEEAIWESIKKAATTSTPDVATQAVKLLNTETLDEVLESIVTVFHDNSGSLAQQKLLSTQLACLAQLYKRIPEKLEKHSPIFIKRLLEEILLKNDLQPSNDNPEWLPQESLDDRCVQKLFVLKVLVNRLRSMTEKDEAKHISTPVFNCLLNLIINHGDILPYSEDMPSSPACSEDIPSSPAYVDSRLRLAAGIGFLRLAKDPVYMKIMDTREISSLSALVQDSCSEVRWNFVRKLTKYLLNGLPREFLPLLFMVADDKDVRMLKYVGEWVQFQMQKQAAKEAAMDKQPGLHFEQAFARLLHMIVRSSDLLNLEPDPLDDDELEYEIQYPELIMSHLTGTAPYIVFFLSKVASESNLPVLFYIAQEIRQYKDRASSNERASTSVSPDRIILISDLAQRCILRLQAAKGWNLTPWPGTLTMPKDLYQLRGDESTSALIPENLLPELDDSLDEIIAKYTKKTVAKIGRKRRGEPKENKKQRKKSRSARKVNRDKENEEPLRRSGRQRDAVHYEESDGTESGSDESTFESDENN